MSLNKEPDSTYYSDDNSKYATVTSYRVYTVECFNNTDGIVNRVTYYDQQLAENSAEDYVLEERN